MLQDRRKFLGLLAGPRATPALAQTPHLPVRRKPAHLK